MDDILTFFLSDSERFNLKAAIILPYLVVQSSY